KEGSFDRLSSAYELMHEKGITSGAVTTISTKNIDILDDIMAFLIEKNVKFWQLQIGLPMGSMAVNSDMILEPSAVDRILDFIHKNGQNGQIKIYPADCLGYYTRKETEIRQIVFNSQVETHWDGCHAGKRSFGILQNGDILGCTSIRDDEFIEGSIRKRPLKEIWMDAESFTWSREMNKSKLK
ncbi:PqqA peptide cyclase, partial [Aduncisulcus paluster]